MSHFWSNFSNEGILKNFAPFIVSSSCKPFLAALALSKLYFLTAIGLGLQDGLWPTFGGEAPWGKSGLDSLGFGTGFALGLSFCFGTATLCFLWRDLHSLWTCLCFCFPFCSTFGFLFSFLSTLLLSWKRLELLQIFGMTFLGNQHVYVDIDLNLHNVT